MQLLLVRHAIAFERDRRRWPQDEDRPLTPEGTRRCRKAAAGAARLLSRPTVVLTSPLVRARDTAAVFTAIARWPIATECAALRPGGDPQAALAALRRTCREGALAALFGHQPDLGVLLALCLRGRARGEGFELKKGAIACVTFPSEARAGTGALNWLAPPKFLRAWRR